MLNSNPHTIWMIAKDSHSANTDLYNISIMSLCKMVWSQHCVFLHLFNGVVLLKSGIAEQQGCWPSAGSQAGAWGPLCSGRALKSADSWRDSHWRGAPHSKPGCTRPWQVCSSFRCDQPDTEKPEGGDSLGYYDLETRDGQKEGGFKRGYVKWSMGKTYWEELEKSMLKDRWDVKSAKDGMDEG